MARFRLDPRAAGARWLAAGALITLTLACSHTIFEGPAGAGSAPVRETAAEGVGTAPEGTPAERWGRALRLLGRGREDRARSLLASLRGTEAYGARATGLLEQIRTPAREYFPFDYFHVELERGQSLSLLAERYLGDALEFYALARYNGITQPAEVAAGQLIRIPLTPAARDVRRAEAGEADADDEVEPASAAAQAGGEGDAATGEQGAPGRQARVERYYRKATVAFYRQDLDATIDYCDRVLELQPDHSNCRLYKLRARELKRRLEGIPEDGGTVE